MLPSARRETRNEGQVEEFPQAGDDSSVFEHSDAETLCDSKDIILDAREVLSLNACGRQLLHLPMVVYPIIGRKRQIEALLDCGADKTYVSNRLARSMKWTKRKLPPRKVELANGETILSNQGVRIPICSGTFRDTLTAYKLDIPQYDLILGLEWLQRWNPIIDWPSGRILIQEPTKRGNPGKVHRLQCHPTSTLAKQTKYVPDDDKFEEGSIKAITQATEQGKGYI